MVQLPAIILNSPNFKTYEHWLINGKSFRECERLAKELFSEEISNDSFRKYKLAMEDRELVPSVLPHADKDIDVDEEKHLMQAILLQEERVMKAVEFEKKSPVPTNIVDKQMEVLTNMLIQLANIRGKGLSARAIVNQQFNRFSGSVSPIVGESDEEFRQRIIGILKKASAEDNKKTVSNSDDELKRWFDGLIQEANENAQKQQTIDTITSAVNPET